MPYLLAHEVRNLLGDATIKNQCATSRVREVVDDFNIPTLQTRAWGDPLRSRKSLARPQVQANSGDSKSVASCMSDYMLQSHLTSGFVGPGSLSKVHALRAGAGCPPCCSSFKASESMNTGTDSSFTFKMLSLSCCSLCISYSTGTKEPQKRRFLTPMKHSGRGVSERGERAWSAGRWLGCVSRARLSAGLPDFHRTLGGGGVSESYA
jgi:hypothetical protein